MRFSVVIPVYNGSKYLPETLQSVLNQTASDLEAVLVDDGSQDGSPDLIRRFAGEDGRVRFFEQREGNVAASRNRGFREARPDTPYLLFVDQDDVPTPDALETLADVLDAHPEYSAAHGLARFVDGDGRPFRISELEDETRARYAVGPGGRARAWPLDRPTTFGVEVISNRVVNGSILIRRSAFEQAGLFDPAVAPADDYDMWLRLSLIGDIGFTDRLVLNYRLHDSNQSRDESLMLQSDVAARRKLLANPALTPEQRATARHGNRWRSWLVARKRLHWAADCLRQRQVGQAAKQVRHAGLNFLQGYRPV